MDWKGYGPDERSWVPARNVLNHAVVRSFHQEHPDQPTKTARIPQPRSLPPRPPPLLDTSDDESEADNVSYRDPSSDEGDVLHEPKMRMEVSDEY